MSLSAIDPVLFSVGQSKTQYLLFKLESFFPTIVTVEKKQSYLEEVNRILVNKTLPKVFAGDGSIQLDKWWSVIFINSKYPVLSAVVKACLSIFIPVSFIIHKRKFYHS